MTEPYPNPDHPGDEPEPQQPDGDEEQQEGEEPKLKPRRR